MAEVMRKMLILEKNFINIKTIFENDNKDGNSMFMIALKKNYDIDTFKYLLKKVEFNPEDKNSFGETIFMFGAKSRNLENFKHLLETYKESFDPNYKNSFGENIFMVAAEFTNYEILKYLLGKYKCPLYEVNKYKETILERILMNPKTNDEIALEFGKLLIDTDPKIVKHLYFRILLYTYELFLLFFSKYGIDVSIKTERGNDIFMILAQNGKDTILSEILKNNYPFDYKSRNNDGYSAIMKAIEYSNFKILNLLKEKMLTTISPEECECIIKEEEKKLYSDFDEKKDVQMLNNFKNYIDIIGTDKENFNKEPCYFDNPNCKVYIIGDLEGDYNILYNWLLSQGFIDENLNWIAGTDVYIIQCGDQLDNGGYSVEFGKLQKESMFLYRRKTIDDGKYYTNDLYLMLLMDYLSIKSNNHVLSILGNHEIMNIQQDFRYVNLSPLNTLDENIPLPPKKRKAAFDYNFGDSIDNVFQYLNERSNFLHKDFSKLIRRRNFIIRFNDLIISHAGLLKDFIEKTNNYFDISDKNGLDKYITNVNNQIRMKTNWYKKTLSTTYVVNLYFVGGKRFDSDDEENINFYTDIFKKITGDDFQMISPIWNRQFSRELDLPQFLEGYIYVIGHNTSDKIHYINREGNEDLNNPILIKTDCGWHGRTYPYLQIAEITYGDNTSVVNPKQIFVLPPQRKIRNLEYKLYDDINKIHIHNETLAVINEKLGDKYKYKYTSYTENKKRKTEGVENTVGKFDGKRQNRRSKSKRQNRRSKSKRQNRRSKSKRQNRRRSKSKRQNRRSKSKRQNRRRSKSKRQNRRRSKSKRQNRRSKK